MRKIQKCGFFYVPSSEKKTEKLFSSHTDFLALYDERCFTSSCPLNISNALLFLNLEPT